MLELSLEKKTIYTVLLSSLLRSVNCQMLVRVATLINSHPRLTGPLTTISHHLLLVNYSMGEGRGAGVVPFKGFITLSKTILLIKGNALK